MVFGNKNKPSIKMDNIDIPLVDSTKFLGVYLDSSLNWNLHTSSLISNLISNRYMLQITKTFMPERAKRLLYYAHILSHINCAHITWGPMCSQQAKDQIYQIQKDCV